MINKVHERLHSTKAWKESKNNIENNIKNGYYGTWNTYTELVERWSEDKRPVICCMAGKSLDFALPKISKLDRGKYRLITIDQTQYRLVEEKLKPDLMFSMDFMNFGELGFFTGMKDTAMVVPCSANTDNVKRWKGMKYIYRSVALGNDELSRAYNQKTLLAGDIGIQYNLSNIGLSVLQFCETIKAKSYWVGLDFGFIDNKTFFDGLYEKFGGVFPVAREIQVNEMENFYTNKQYAVFALSFLNYLTAHKYEIGYCSRGGLLDIEIKNDKGERIDQYVRRCELEEIV